MRSWLLPLALVALLAAGVAWFLSTHERVAHKVWVGASGEAKRNTLLAALRFTERMGINAVEIRAIPQLVDLAVGDVLVLAKGRQVIDPLSRERIIEWVKHGGHLIAEAEILNVSDPLLEVLDVKRIPHARMPRMLDAKVYEIEIPKRARPLKVSFPYAISLDPSDNTVVFKIADKEATKLVSFSYGGGLVTVAASLDFARNNQIGLHDDADFFWYLLSMRNAETLKLYGSVQKLSLWRFLTEHAAPVLAAVAALIALWLWRIAPRFGPVRPDPAPARRRLLDHLRASGRFYWAQGLRGRLLAAARDAALRRIARAQPDFAQAGQAERAARIAALAQIPPAEAQRFMSAGANLPGAEFIRAMHTAQRIHAALERGAR